MDVVKLSQKPLGRAIAALKEDKIIICATDTVYGFLADAENKKTVDKIYKIKKRPRSKPFPVFVKNFKAAKDLAKIDEKQEKIIKKYWPGKTTFVLIKKEKIQLYDGGKDTIALRVPKHKFLNSLLNKINKPLVQTSVNISGQRTLSKSKEITGQFKKLKDVLFIDAKDLPKSRPSAIIDLTKNNIKILRK